MRTAGPPTVRRALRNALRKRASRIINSHAGHPVLEKFMTMLSNALPSLFRFATDPAIHATNNAIGRALRELAVHRRVRGSIRSGKTTDRPANLCTRVATWKARGIGYAAQVARCVRAERRLQTRKQSKEKTPGNQPVISCFMRADYLSRLILREEHVRMTRMLTKRLYAHITHYHHDKGCQAV